jgi:polyisoprenoid-binding protein YceI
MAQWTLDPAHSSVEFSAKHMMITTVRGRMNVTSGSIDFDPANPAAASVDAVLDVSSLNSGLSERDGHLKSPDFLDAASFPTVHFVSVQVEPIGEGKARIQGDLTIRGVTRRVTLDAEFLGAALNPFDKSERAGFVATTAINREDWGLTWNVALEAGGWLVGKEIKIALDVQAVKVTAAVNA